MPRHAEVLQNGERSFDGRCRILQVGVATVRGETWEARREVAVSISDEGDTGSRRLHSTWGGGGPQSGRGQVEEAHHGQPVAQAEGERQAEGTTNGRQAGLLQRMAMLRPGMNAKLFSSSRFLSEKKSVFIHRGLVANGISAWP